MASPVLNQATVADLADISQGINLITARPEGRWNKSLSVEVTDAPMSDGSTGSAVYVSQGLHHPWRRMKANTAAPGAAFDKLSVIVPV